MPLTSFWCLHPPKDISAFVLHSKVCPHAHACTVGILQPAFIFQKSFTFIFLLLPPAAILPPLSVHLSKLCLCLSVKYNNRIFFKSVSYELLQLFFFSLNLHLHVPGGHTIICIPYIPGLVSMKI